MLIFQIYYISRGSVKTANKKYTSLKNDYELSLNNDSEIELVRKVFKFFWNPNQFLPITDVYLKRYL